VHLADNGVIFQKYGGSATVVKQLLKFGKPCNDVDSDTDSSSDGSDSDSTADEDKDLRSLVGEPKAKPKAKGKPKAKAKAKVKAVKPFSREEQLEQFNWAVQQVFISICLMVFTESAPISILGARPSQIPSEHYTPVIERTRNHNCVCECVCECVCDCVCVRVCVDVRCLCTVCFMLVLLFTGSHRNRSEATPAQVWGSDSGKSQHHQSPVLGQFMNQNVVSVLLVACA
jgi:hypothetical protein